MLHKVLSLLTEYRTLEDQLAQPEVTHDLARFKQLSIRHSQLEGLLPLLQEYKQNAQALTDAEDMLASNDSELMNMASIQKTESQELQLRLDEQLTKALLPKDPNDHKNVMLEVRAGTGGEEAALFASELARAYMRYAEIAGYKS